VTSRKKSIREGGTTSRGRKSLSQKEKYKGAQKETIVIKEVPNTNLLTHKSHMPCLACLLGKLSLEGRLFRNRCRQNGNGKVEGSGTRRKEVI